MTHVARHGSRIHTLDDYRSSDAPLLRPDDVKIAAVRDALGAVVVDIERSRSEREENEKTLERVERLLVACGDRTASSETEQGRTFSALQVRHQALQMQVDALRKRAEETDRLNSSLTYLSVGAGCLIALLSKNARSTPSSFDRGATFVALAVSVYAFAHVFSSERTESVQDLSIRPLKMDSLLNI